MCTPHLWKHPKWVERTASPWTSRGLQPSWADQEGEMCHAGGVWTEMLWPVLSSGCCVGLLPHPARCQAVSPLNLRGRGWVPAPVQVSRNTHLGGESGFPLNQIQGLEKHRGGPEGLGGGEWPEEVRVQFTSFLSHHTPPFPTPQSPRRWEQLIQFPPSSAATANPSPGAQAALEA